MQFVLTNAELAERISSGQSTIFENRVGWARTYLKKAGLIEPVLRGQYRITPRGLEVVKSKPLKIDVAFLKRFPEYIDFITPKSGGQSQSIAITEPTDAQTPLELLEGAYQRLRKELADELLQMMDFGVGVTEGDTYKVKKLDRDYFEE